MQPMRRGDNGVYASVADGAGYGQTPQPLTRADAACAVAVTLGCYGVCFLLIWAVTALKWG